MEFQIAMTYGNDIYLTLKRISVVSENRNLYQFIDDIGDTRRFHLSMLNKI